VATKIRCKNNKIYFIIFAFLQAEYYKFDG